MRKDSLSSRVAEVLSAAVFGIGLAAASIVGCSNQATIVQPAKEYGTPKPSEYTTPKEPKIIRLDPDVEGTVIDVKVIEP